MLGNLHMAKSSTNELLISASSQWECQDPKWRYCTVYIYKAIFRVHIPLCRPYIGLIYGRYVRVRFLKWPLIIPKIWMSLTIGFHLAEVGIWCPLQWGSIATVEYCEILHHIGWFFSPWNNGMFTTYQLVQDFAAIHSITLCMSQTIKDLGGQRLECLCLVLTIQLLGPPVRLDGLENQLTIWRHIGSRIINQCETGVMFTNLGASSGPHFATSKLGDGFI